MHSIRSASHKMPYRSTSTPEYPPDGKSIGTCEQTAYEITIKNPRSNSEKIAQIFPQTCHAFCLRDSLLIWMLKIKKIQCYYESSNSGFTNEAECQCYESLNCIIFSKRVESDSKTIICKLGLKKQPTFSDATFRFPTKWHVRKKHRNSITHDELLPRSW